MIIIWKGYGFLVPFIIVSVVGAISVLSWLLFPTTVFLGPCIGSFLAAAAVWYIGKKFNSPLKNRVMIDKQSGQEFILKPDHSLFFIKMQYWAFVMAPIGLFLFIAMVIAP